MYSFPNLEPVGSSMFGSSCCFLTWIQVSQEVKWSGIPISFFQNFPQFVVIHTVKGFSIVSEAISFLGTYPVQFSSVTQLWLTLCNPMVPASVLVPRLVPGFPVHHQLLEFTQTHVHPVSDAIQPSHPLSSSSPAFNISSIRVFSSESVLRMRWPKYWSFSFSISPSKEYSGLISFRMDWLGLLAVQGTLNISRHNCNSKRNMHPNVHCVTIHNSQDMEAT